MEREISFGIREMGDFVGMNALEHFNHGVFFVENMLLLWKLRALQVSSTTV